MGTLNDLLLDKVDVDLATMATTGKLESFSIYQVSHAPSGPNDNKKKTKSVMDVTGYFQPLVNIMRCFGFLITREEGAMKKFWTQFMIGQRVVYMSAMWTWTVLMSINIFWLAIVETNEDGGVSPVDGQHANMIVTMLNETPYSFITIRNATILTLFVCYGPEIVKGIKLCEELRGKIANYGTTLSMDKSDRRPILLILYTVTLIILWEVYEWNVWLGTLGVRYQWKCSPLPFTIVHYGYASLWVSFTSIPFVFSQLALCFPVLFACVLKSFLTFVNTELGNLAKAATANIPEVLHGQLSHRLFMLRRIHFEISQLVRKLDKLSRAMLLWQFILDIIVLFGFVGLLINSKDAKPPKQTIEWTFYIPSSVLWFAFFLLYFSFPLIHMANEVRKNQSFGDLMEKCL